MTAPDGNPDSFIDDHGDTLTPPGKVARLRAVALREFLEMDIPPREMLLDPILPSQGLAMLYAPRGVGKTHVALGIAYAVATGGTFLRWRADRPRRVLYVDGEMPARTMQDRLRAYDSGRAAGPLIHDNLRLVTPDLQDGPIPDLLTVDGQNAIRELLDGIELLILDNLSALCRSGRENEADSWQPAQDFLLALRRAGVTVLIVHHAGKGGNQRGTSRREDVLDTVIALRRPDDYDSEQGARFEVHLDKARGIFGADAKAFEAQLSERNGLAEWSVRGIEDQRIALVLELRQQGKTLREIEDETGIKKSTVERLLKKANANGHATATPTN
ncbi:MAG: AAA family ATPase [Rhizobiaceae bacterium]